MRRWPGYASRCTERGPSRTSLRRMEGETCQTSGWGIGSCLDQLCTKGRPDSGDPSRDLRKMATAEDAADRRCLVLSDCKPALQQIEAAYRKGSLEGLREWDRGGILEGICRYRAQLESVTFLWVPSHAGCASNAYADAAATAYMGASEIEDATAVIREAVRTRPCLYTDRRRTADREGGREVLDRRTYYATRGHTNEWVRGRLGEGLTAGSHTAGVTGPLWSDVVRGTTRHKWDKRQRIKDQHGEREIEFADVDDHNVVTKTVMGARVRQQAGVPHGAHHERIMRGEAGKETPGAATRSELRGCLVCKAARDAARRAALKRDPLCPVARKAAQQWTEEDENPPQSSASADGDGDQQSSTGGTRLQGYAEDAEESACRCAEGLTL
mmetsp:Transcript_24704/g.81431  ORF Transcript_24704/g.81431 Transcript_24704/m.81431 type:complete len:385 (+) Transcript_24704:1042-2196(+)